MDTLGLVVISLAGLIAIWYLTTQSKRDLKMGEEPNPQYSIKDSSMYQVMVNRDKIYDHVDGFGSDCNWTQGSTHEEFEKYCIAKDTVQDTSEAISAHEEKGFCSGTSLRYIEYYGLLQAVYLQQDSILALHKLFGKEMELNISSYPAWNEIRELRNDTVGHPVGRRKRLNRNQISYNDVHYMFIKKEDINSWESCHIDLNDLLQRYGNEAGEILKEIHENMWKICGEKHA